MTIEVKVPALPESVADAVLLNWHKKEGEYVKQGENLADLETDKVVLELPAPVSGFIEKTVAQIGDTVTGGDVVAQIKAADAPNETAASEVIQETAQSVAISETNTAKASPAAKKIAAENNINPAEIIGSGRGGRITKNDVVQKIKGVRFEERIPMTRLRKRIAERLVDAQHTAAMLTTFNEVNMQSIMELRKKYQDQFVKKNSVKLGFMSFFVKAAIAALKKFPAINASIDGDDIIYHNFYDIGIAVSAPRGLVVPIIRNAEALSFAEIEQQIIDFSEKSKNGTLSIEEMSGGTFSITNGGTFGSMLSTPILNPPQSAILGMHNIVDRPVVENGAVVIRPIMYLALTYDHRLVDGREAVSFLVSIKNALEDPARLLLDL